MTLPPVNIGAISAGLSREIESPLQDFTPTPVSDRSLINFDLNSAYDYLAEQGLSADDMEKEIARVIGKKAKFDTEKALEAGFTPAQVISKLTGVKPAAIEAGAEGFASGAIPGGTASLAGLVAAKSVAALTPFAAASAVGIAVGLGAGLLTLMSGLPDLIVDAVVDDDQILPSDRAIREGAETAGFVVSAAGPTGALAKTAGTQTVDLFKSQVLKNLAEQSGRATIAQRAKAGSLQAGSTVAGALEKSLAAANKLRANRSALEKSTRVLGQATALGVAGGTAEAFFPQNDLVRFSAELFAPARSIENLAVASGKAIAAAPSGVSTLARAIRQPRQTFETAVSGAGELGKKGAGLFRKRGLDAAAKDLGETLKIFTANKDGTVNAERYAEYVTGLISRLEQRAKSPEAEKLTIADLLGDPILKEFERNLGPAFAVRAENAQRDAIELFTLGVKGLTESPAPNIVRAAIQTYDDIFRNLLQTGVDRQATDAALAVDKVLKRQQDAGASEQTLSKTLQEGSTKVVEAVAQSLKAARSAESALYKRINKTVKVQAPNVIDAFIRMQDDATGTLKSATEVAKIDATVRDLLGKAGAFLPAVATENLARQVVSLEKKIDNKKFIFDNDSATNKPAKAAFDKFMGNRKEGSVAYANRLDAGSEGFNKNLKEDGAFGIELNSRTRNGVRKLIKNRIESNRLQQSLKELSTVPSIAQVQPNDLPLGQLMRLRSRLLELNRNLPEDQKLFRSVYAELADRILDDYDLALRSSPLQKNVQAASDLRDAVTYSKALNDVFTRTFAGDILSKRKGRERRPPELVAQDILKGDPQTTQLQLDEIQNAISFLSPGGVGRELTLAGGLPSRLDPGRTGDLGRGRGMSVDLEEAAARPIASLNEGFDQYIRAALAQPELNLLRREGEQLVLNKEKFDAFINSPTGVNFKKVLDLPSFAALKSDLADAQKANDILDGLVQQKGEIFENIQKQKGLSAFLDIENPAAKFSEITRLSSTPTADLQKISDDIAKLANEGKQVEETALRQAAMDAMFDSIFEQAKNPAFAKFDPNGNPLPILDFQKVDDLVFNTNKVNNRFTKDKPLGEVLVETNIFKQETLDSLKDFVERAKNIQRAALDPEGKDPQEFNAVMQEMINSYVTLRAASTFASATGGGGSIQAPAVFNKIRQYIGSLPELHKNRILQEALGPGAAWLAPDNAALLQNLLQRDLDITQNGSLVDQAIDSVQNYFQARRFIKPIRATGLEAQRDVRDEPVPQRPVQPPAPPIPGPQPAVLTPDVMGQAAPPPAPTQNLRQRYAALYPDDPISPLIESQGIGTLPR